MVSNASPSPHGARYEATMRVFSAKGVQRATYRGRLVTVRIGAGTGRGAAAIETIEAPDGTVILRVQLGPGWQLQQVE